MRVSTHTKRLTALFLMILCMAAAPRTAEASDWWDWCDPLLYTAAPSAVAPAGVPVLSWFLDGATLYAPGQCDAQTNGQEVRASVDTHIEYRLEDSTWLGVDYLNYSETICIPLGQTFEANEVADAVLDTALAAMGGAAAAQIAHNNRDVVIDAVRSAAPSIPQTTVFDSTISWMGSAAARTVGKMVTGA